LFYQHASDLVVESIIQTHYEISQPIATKVDAPMSLTYEENNALRYAAFEIIPAHLF